MYSIDGGPLIETIWQIFTDDFSPSFAFRLPATLLVQIIFSYALLFGQYVRLQLCVYRRNHAYHRSFSSTATYGSPAALQDCSKRPSSVDKVLRLQSSKRHV